VEDFIKKMNRALKRGASSISFSDNITLTQKSGALKRLYPILFVQQKPSMGRASGLVDYLSFTSSVKTAVGLIGWCDGFLIGGWVWFGGIWGFDNLRPVAVSE
jgi:hypothetical protein